MLKDKSIRIDMESKSSSKESKPNKTNDKPVSKEEKAKNFETALQDLFVEMEKREEMHYANYLDFSNFITAIKTEIL
jgi:hypothetical protein